MFSFGPMELVVIAVIAMVLLAPIAIAVIALIVVAKKSSGNKEYPAPAPRSVEETPSDS